MNFLHTDARWTEHFVEVSDPHKEGHHVRFYFERPWVGLTYEDQEEIVLSAHSIRDAINKTDWKLKEKNCDNRN
jgi:hypothetical protein